MLAFWHDVVARFEPEWNSLGVNKTRAVNILGGVQETGYTVLLRSPGPRKVPGTAVSSRDSEVFVMIGLRIWPTAAENAANRVPALHPTGKPADKPHAAGA
jgi:hypothetical protein